jgi:hypothetical protein
MALATAFAVAEKELDATLVAAAVTLPLFPTAWT